MDNLCNKRIMKGCQRCPYHDETIAENYRKQVEVLQEKYVIPNGDIVQVWLIQLMVKWILPLPRKSMDQLT